MFEKESWTLGIKLPCTMHKRQSLLCMTNDNCITNGGAALGYRGSDRTTCWIPNHKRNMKQMCEITVNTINLEYLQTSRITFKKLRNPISAFLQAGDSYLTDSSWNASSIRTQTNRSRWRFLDITNPLCLARIVRANIKYGTFCPRTTQTSNFPSGLSVAG